MSQPYTAIVTLAALLLYFVLIGRVAMARGQYGIKAPAVAGNEHFERAYRIQMNTLEQMALFLPARWLYSAYVSDRGAVRRVIYALAYTRDPASRGPGAMITLFASVGLWLGAAYGVVRALI